MTGSINETYYAGLTDVSRKKNNLHKMRLDADVWIPQIVSYVTSK